MGKCFNHLTWDDRIRIDTLLKQQVSVNKIAKILGIHRSTVYREIKRGQYENLNTDLTTEYKYSPDLAYEKYKENLSVKGCELKIGSDIEFANYIEDMICNKQYSPVAVLLKIKNENIDFKTSICKTTLYSYIDKGIFYNLTNKALPVKKNEKRRYSKVKKRTRVLGDSIEKRPEYIESREEFGHWEMDLVIGKQKKEKSLLVLTERKTRKEIVKIITTKSSINVVNELNKIEKQIGKKKFTEIFKTITVDNGSEFADCNGIENSIYTNKRTKVYYCHPYSSYERGTNENCNKFIRRWLPKGTSFKNLTSKKIKELENWINEYPRLLFNGNSSSDEWDREIKNLGLRVSI